MKFWAKLVMVCGLSIAIGTSVVSFDESTKPTRNSTQVADPGGGGSEPSSIPDKKVLFKKPEQMTVI